MAAAMPDAVPRAIDSGPPWSPARRVLFRLLCAYFALYVLPFPIQYVFIGPVQQGVTRSYESLWHEAVPWFGRHALGIEVTTRPGGSGDTTYNYVQLLMTALAALAICTAWSLLDRRRHRRRHDGTQHDRGQHDRRLAQWLWIACRYYLAYYMLLYGFVKVFKAQFPFPLPSRLVQPYGESSPMGLLWTFMGYSTVYNVFAGGAEVLGGLLLFLRRTTTLGALVVIAVMGNVTMLNFCYDVPVKLFSMHLLAMGIALAWVDRKRLLAVLVQNRAAPAADLSPPFRNRWLSRARLVLKVLLPASALLQCVVMGVTSVGQLAHKPPLYGVHDVETFVRDGVEVPPLTTDGSRWRRLIVDWHGGALVRFMDRRSDFLRFEVDSDAGTVRVAPAQNRDAVRTWTLERPEPGVLRLTGTWDDRELSMELRTRDLDEFLLVDRGFHWINEYPFNR